MWKHYLGVLVFLTLMNLITNRQTGVVLKAPFLTHTENFDTKDIVKLYMNVADSSVLLLWLTDRDAEKKVICNQQ